MKSITEIIDSLYRILSVIEPVRTNLIKSFQNEVWNDKSINDETINSILSELTYDLDFYEPNENCRKEDPVYYGDERLEREIKTAIQKLQEYN